MFEEFDVCSRFVEFDHRVYDERMIRDFLVSIGVGEEEELYLFDPSEYDFDGLIMIHRLRKAEKGCLDFLQAGCVVQALEAYIDGERIVVTKSASSHGGRVVRFVDRPLQHIFECGADVLEGVTKGLSGSSTL